MLPVNEKTLIFIDGASLYYGSKKCGLNIDYAKLREYFASRTKLIRAYYYASIVESEDYTPLKPLTDWLAYNGFTTILKEAYELPSEGGERRLRNTNVDCEIITDMMDMADHCDHIVLFSARNDYRRAIEAVQRKGKLVTVVSSRDQISDELRRIVDNYIDIESLRSYVSNEKVPERAANRSSKPPITMG